MKIRIVFDIPVWVRALWFFSAILVLKAPFSLALDPDVPINHYTVEVFTQAHGLPQDYVSDIVQDSMGYLWIATQEGLVRFDGVRFKVINRKSEPALVENFTVSLAVREDGGVWIGMRGGTISLLEQKQGLNIRETVSGLKGSWVQALLSDDQGVLWAGGRSGGLARWFSHDHDAQLTPVENFEDTRIFDLLRDQKGRIWVATENRGIACLEDDTTLWFDTGNGLPGNNVRAMAEDHNGEIWAVVYGGGLVHIVDDKISATYDTSDGLVSLRLLSLLLDREGNLWLGTEGFGIGRFSNHRLSDWAVDGSLAGLTVQSFFEDREGNLWVGTSGDGLMRLTDSLFTVVNSRSGLHEAQVSCVLEDPTHQIWVGTIGGLYRLHMQSGNFISSTLVADFEDISVISMFADEKGALWVGTYEHGIARIFESEVSWWTAADGLPSESIWSIEGDGLGGLWIGTYGGGAIHATDDGFTIVDDSDGLTNNIIRAIKRDRDGKIWLGTGGGGLAHLDNGQLRVNPSTSLLATAGVLDFWEDDDGSMWFGTGGSGLCRLLDQELTCLGTDEGLFDDTVFRLLVDQRQRLWMSCNRGVFHAPLKELRAVFDGEAVKVQCRVFGRAEGMPTPECNGGNQPVGWLDHRGTLWFPTSKGLVGIDSKHVPPAQTAPRVIIETLRADGTNYEPHHSVDLAPGTRFVEIDFTALTLVAPDMLSFRYRLIGLTEEWTEIQGRRTVYFTTLPPGDFELTVQARRPHGAWGIPSETLRLDISPYFFEKRSVQILALLTLMFSAVALYLRKIHSHRQRERQLQKLVDEATHDLEVANIRLLDLSLEDALTGIGNRRRFDQVMHMVWDHAIRSRESVSLIMIDIDHFKNYNDSLGHVAGDVCLKRVAEVCSASVRRNSDILTRYGGEEFTVLLPNTDLAHATQLAEQIRAAVENLKLPHPASEDGILTLSIGVAHVLPNPGSTAEELILKADEAMYRAKETGRNRVEESSDRQDS